MVELVTIIPVRVGFAATFCNKVATVTLHTPEHGVPGVRTPLGVVPVNSINQPPISHHMGVCTEERPVMHWHQSARFLGPPRERSPDLTNACQLSSNNNNINHRTCISCTDTCEHSLKATQGGPGGPNAGGLLGVNHIYTDSCHSFESVPDRLIADRPNYFADLNRSDCSDSSSVLNSCIQLKSEPPGGPSSPESSNELPPTGLDECAGCDMPIQDRFYLSAVERKWHASCLQCCICRQTLEGANSCFSRDGNIYCKTDYYR
ncbi:protein apterous-like [Anopheles cruzii]|uniref:protein apterous-like n=1 Tax=Anopheles cruzii TaxID=68878 RepID=UPI0022EC337D|nr:protein apterous-like [Anopheles cruzii]